MNPLNIQRDIHNSLLISFYLDLIPVSLISLPYPYSFLTLSTISYDSVYIFYLLYIFCPLLLSACFGLEMWVLLQQMGQSICPLHQWPNREPPLWPRAMKLALGAGGGAALQQLTPFDSSWPLHQRHVSLSLLGREAAARDWQSSILSQP